MTAGAFLTHARYLPGPILGRGGQGVVGRVVDREAPDRALVAKVWRPGAFREEALYGEFALLARLRVPGVVRAHDLGRDERSGAPFFVEELVPGDDAGTWVSAAPLCDRAGRLVGVLRDVARALAALHGAGFLHSDLKPAHVRMRPARGGGEEAVLLDLGASVARAKAQGGQAAFTAGFAAPELLAGSAPSTASDLFGLGALGWALAAGRPPEVGRSRGELREAAPWVTPSVADVIEGLLELHPRDRPSSALEVLGALGAATAEAGIGLGALAAPLGRERELGELLASKPASVRTITGPGGVTISTTRFMAPARKASDAAEALGPVHIRHNFSPSAAQVGGHFILGSSLGLTRDLIKALKSPGKPDDATLAVEAEGAALADLVGLNRDRLMMQSMLEKGHDKDQAGAEVDLLASLLRYLGHGRLTIRDRGDATRVALEFSLGK